MQYNKAKKMLDGYKDKINNILKMHVEKIKKAMQPNKKNKGKSTNE